MTLMTLRIALIATALFASSSAWAGTVKGTVKLPENARSTRLYQGYWRLENGNVPVQSSGVSRSNKHAVVVLWKWI